MEAQRLWLHRRNKRRNCHKHEVEESWKDNSMSSRKSGTKASAQSHATSSLKNFIRPVPGPSQPEASTQDGSKSSKTLSRASSVSSDSSTLMWDHEPFETYQKRVRDFCKKKWPSAVHEKIVVERMEGGHYNRIIGLTIVQSKDKNCKKSDISRLILRIPRDDYSRHSSDVSTLQLASQYAKISVPKVFSFQSSPDDHLGKPYMIQNRMPGAKLHDAYRSLTYRQKCLLAQELGQLFRKLMSCKNDSAGAFVPSGENPAYIQVQKTFPGVVASLRPFGKDDPILFGMEDPLRQSVQYDADPKGMTWVQTLRAAYQYRQKVALARDPPDKLDAEYMEDFAWTLSAFENLFARFKNENCLCHLDLAPRNILINPTAAGSPIILGIIDWDNAVFAPSFLACAPPMWLWAWNPEGDEDERRVNDPLPTDEARRLKKTFDEAAGTTFCQLAYPPEFRLARTLCTFAHRPFNSDEYNREADVFFKEFAEVRRAPGSRLSAPKKR
ncbi:MAG: hypothetical protein Q9227_008060 [Pyrenula ochraceoflavens]